MNFVNYQAKAVKTSKHLFGTSEYVTPSYLQHPCCTNFRAGHSSHTCRTRMLAYSYLIQIVCSFIAFPRECYGGYSIQFHSFLNFHSFWVDVKFLLPARQGQSFTSRLQSSTAPPIWDLGTSYDR